MKKATTKPTARRTSRATVPAPEVSEREVEGATATTLPPVLNIAQSRFLTMVSGEAADGLLMNMMGEQITAKLAQNRQNGRWGWHTEHCTNDDLRAMLKKLAAKGDYIDAAIVAGMLLVREQLGHTE